MAYLIYDAVCGQKNGNVFANLVHQPKRWDMLAAAWVSCTLAVLLTFLRWWYLVRALGVPCRFRDAIRISFWGFLFNLAPLGIVGGDVVKAVMLDHEHPHNRAKAVASVLVDRVIGLYVLFLVASAAILLTGFWQINVPDIFWTPWFNISIFATCMATFCLTIAGTVALGIVLGPEALVNRAIQAIGRIPRAGKPLESLIVAVRMYNRKPQVLTLSALMTVGVHGLFAIGCYLIACGLPGNRLPWTQYFVVIPLSAASQVIPLPLGPFEGILKCFYDRLPVAGSPILAGQGLVVALAYRVIMILIAVLGIRYYLGNRREMAEVMHEAEAE